MAILKKDPISGSYVIKPGDTLSKVASTQGITLAELLATNPQFAATPNMVQPGDVVKVGANSQAGFTLPNASTGTPPAGAPAPTPSGGGQTESVYALLKQILEKNQPANAASYTNDTNRLLKGKENIVATNSGVYSQDLADQNLTPTARLALLGNDSTIQNPGLTNIADQMKSKEALYNSTNDTLKTVTSAYNDIEDRKQRAEEARLNRAASAANKANNFDNDTNISAVAQAMAKNTGKAKGEVNGDNYISPYEWIDARNAWAARGGSDSTFVSNFKRFLNPKSYALAGFKDTEALSPGLQALMNWADGQ